MRIDTVPAGIREELRAKTGALLLETQLEQHSQQTSKQLTIGYSHGAFPYRAGPLGAASHQFLSWPRLLLTGAAGNAITRTKSAP